VSARHYCRHCRSKLGEPEENTRRAFCARGCHSSFYRHRCLACEAKFERKNEVQKTCGRHPCRNALKSRPDAYAYLRKGNHPSTSEGTGRSAHSTAIKWRLVAGPSLDPVSSRLATLPLDAATAKRVDGDNARYWREDRAALLPYARLIESRLLPDDLPVVDSPPIATSDDPSDIPSFLDRTMELPYETSP
jgi:hypothetical protein